MPLRHVAQTVGLNYHLLEKQGVYKVPLPPNGRPWSEREVRILRRDYAKPGSLLRTITAKLGRTCLGVNSKAPSLRSKLAARIPGIGASQLSDHQQAEALRRLAAGESWRAIARIFHVHHSAISRLASSR